MIERVNHHIHEHQQSPYQFVEDIYEYLDTHTPLLVPDWLSQYNNGDEFVAIQQIENAYRYVDYQHIAQGAYSSLSPSRIILDHFETMYQNGIYKVVNKQAHPDYVMFNKRRLISPNELEVTVIEEVSIPQKIKTKKYLIALFNGTI